MTQPSITGLVLLFWLQAVSAGTEKPNVLLILVDDLKPLMGCYGDPIAKTPNMDALAARGLRFDLAYCNQAVCAPSRFTLMLGAHSSSTGLYGLGSSLRDLVPDAVTMPQHFAKEGYRTESLGKVFHIGHGNEGDPDSFMVPHFKDKVIEYLDPASTDGGQLTREEALFTNQKLGEIKSLPRGAAYESPDVADEEYADGRVAREAVERLSAAKDRREKEGTPFFMAVGFVRPHLPFSAPKCYWDLYDPANLPMPELEQFPEGAPEVAGKKGGEIVAYSPVPEKIPGAEYPEDLKRNLIHGYYASMSFVDAQIGKVIAALDELKLDENTIVVLWGDHGFHLGDHGVWTKHTNYEQATRIPILITAPGVTTAGSSTRQLAETVDIFPTLAELAGLPAPLGPQAVDGVSLVPVLKDPKARVRDHAYHVWPGRKMGRAIRTERFRMVEWNGPLEYELYDYLEDPLEKSNLAGERPAAMKRLQAMLAKYPDPLPQGGRERNGAKGAKSSPAPAAVPVASAPVTPVAKPMSREEIESGLKSHDRALFVHSSWIRDPYLVKGTDGWFYLTGTTPNSGDPREGNDPYNTGLGETSLVGSHVNVWRSRDFIDWESVGAPYSLKDGIWYQENRAKFDETDAKKWWLWAPELHWIEEQKRWALVHTSPSPVAGANLSLSAGPEVSGPWENPMGKEIGRRHDPSLFRDDDGTYWMIWGATSIAPLKADFSGFSGDPVPIRPSGETAKMGHEGCLIMKIEGKYVLFGTGWSTGNMREGSYNLYYATANTITGPYSERKFAGRFLGHGTPFQDAEGRWWCTAFYNGNVPPESREGIESRDLGDTARTINQRGTTLVPLDVKMGENGELIIRAKDPAYATPGPDEAQKF
jgi:iduronate 2-sulfatase